MEPIVRRTLAGLAVSYALVWATVSMVAGPGSAALVALSGRLSAAGLFIALFYLGTAGGAAVAGRLMDRHGRRPVLIAGALLGAVGFAVAGIAVDVGSLAAFVAGSFVFAAGFGAVNLSRVAAAEMFPPAERGKGVGWLQLSATAGAVLGPLLLILSGPLGHLLGRPPLTLVWFLAPPLLLAAALSYWRIREPTSIAREVAAQQAVVAPMQTPARGAGPRLLIGAAVALAATQGAMAAVMGVAGAAAGHAGHGVHVLGTWMVLHFVGMFGLSRFVGRIADRFGRRSTIMAGLSLLGFGGAVVALVPGVVGFAVGLLLVGFGWSFGFIGATVLITDVALPARRGRVLGRADLGAQLTGAVVAAAGGWWFAVNGVVGLGILAVLVVAVPFVLLLFMPPVRPQAEVGV